MSNVCIVYDVPTNNYFIYLIMTN